MKFKKLVVLDKVDFFNDQKEQLSSLADKIEIYEDTPKNDEEAIKRIGDADGIITSWTTITKNILDNTPNLKYLGIYATGYSWIDVKTAKEKGIIITNVPGYATESVAEMVFCQLLSLLRKSRQADTFVRETGKFERDGFFGEELAGKTIGIISLGKIGSRVAELAKAFKMNVIYHSRTKKQVPYEFYENLDKMIPKCDIITMHSSSGDEFLDAKRLSKLKDGAVVINFGVAGAVNEDALVKELESGRLRAVIDHFVNHKIRQEFRDEKNITILSPEIGYYTKEALIKLAQTTVDNAKSYLQGKVQNKVN